MKTETLVIIGAIGVVLYLQSKKKPGTAGAAGSKNGVKQTSPYQNNPATGINSGAKNTTGGKNGLNDINGTINTVKNGANAAVDFVTGLFGGSKSSGSSSTPQTSSDSAAVGGTFDNNNNATGNQSFDDLDAMGDVSGGWGTTADVNSMTLPDNTDNSEETATA